VTPYRSLPWKLLFDQLPQWRLIEFHSISFRRTKDWISS
jgi:hypothetical protein